MKPSKSFERSSPVLPHLDDRAFRLLLGAEARAPVHGAITAVGRATDVALSTTTIATELPDYGHRPGTETVAKLLKGNGFGLQANNRRSGKRKLPTSMPKPPTTSETNSPRI